MDEKGKTEPQTRKEGRLELFNEFADNKEKPKIWRAFI